MPRGLEPFSPSAQDRWDVAKAAHLLRRAGFGPLTSEVAQAIQAGPDGAVDAIFAFPPAPESVVEYGEIRPAEVGGEEVVGGRRLARDIAEESRGVRVV